MEKSRCTSKGCWPSGVITPIGLIRNAAQEADVIAAGAHPVVIDLEKTTAATIFPNNLPVRTRWCSPPVRVRGVPPSARTASTGPPLPCSPTRRHWPVSAATCWCRRSASDAGAQPDHDPVFAAYMTAKKAADDDLRGARPGLDRRATGRSDRLPPAAGTSR